MKRDTERQTEFRNVAFTVVGLLALLAYILACRPSWSPDGSKLLYSYYNRKAGEVGVALLDRANGTTRSIFAVPDPSDVEHRRIFAVAQWEAGGERAMVLSQDEILLLSLDSPEPHQRFELPNGADWMNLPIPEIAGSLYFGGDTVSKVDLHTGEVTSRDTEENVALYGAGDIVYYRVKRYEPASDSRDDRIVLGEEFGRLNLEELTLVPLFELDKKVLDKYGLDDNPFLSPALDPSGKRMALAGNGPTGTFILLFSEAGLQEAIVPELPLEQYVLGDLDWSPDGETLYAAAFSPAKSSGFWIFRGDRMMFSVAEIPMDAAPSRLIPIARMSMKFDECLYCPVLRIALSADGSTLATSTASLGPGSIKEQDRALYMVDVKDPARRVTKFPPPFSGDEPVVAVGHP